MMVERLFRKGSAAYFFLNQLRTIVRQRMYMRLRETTLLLLALWLQLCAAQTPEQTHYCGACIAAGGAWFTGENSSLGSPTYAHDSQVRPATRIRMSAFDACADVFV